MYSRHVVVNARNASGHPDKLTANGVKIDQNE